MRIAVGGLHTECSTFNPLEITCDDFRILRGAEITAHAEFRPLRSFDATWLPTLHARAVPGGPIAFDSYQALKREFLDRLASLRSLDGLYLSMHGAASVTGMEDAEGDWIAAARAAVGPACPIAASYDLHGNVSQRVIDGLDMFSAYRTAPHVDVDETKHRAVAMLIHAIASGVRPHLAWVPVPVLLPGERTSTLDEPARSLYGALPAIDALPGIADASLLVGYVWADEPRATASVVLTGTDGATMTREAARLAQAYFAARRHFTFGPATGSVAECLDIALNSQTAPVIFAESGDNPTGGGVGDRAEVLAELIRRGARDTLVAGIADRPATEACYAAGPGGRLTLNIGATLDPRGSQPVSARVMVKYLAEAAEPAERQAVVSIGGITVALTARRRPFHTFGDFFAVGLNPRTVRLLVVKSGYLSPDLAPIANPNLMALSPGVVDQHVERTPRQRIARPCYPFDADFDWTPQPRLSARAPAAAQARVA
jgi:microcystin degradation protein MlrC